MKFCQRHLVEMRERWFRNLFLSVEISKNSRTNDVDEFVTRSLELRQDALNYIIDFLIDQHTKSWTQWPVKSFGGSYPKRQQQIRNSTEKIPNKWKKNLQIHLRKRKMFSLKCFVKNIVVSCLKLECLTRWKNWVKWDTREPSCY